MHAYEGARASPLHSSRIAHCLAARQAGFLAPVLFLDFCATRAFIAREVVDSLGINSFIVSRLPVKDQCENDEKCCDSLLFLSIFYAKMRRRTNCHFFMLLSTQYQSRLPTVCCPGSIRYETYKIVKSTKDIKGNPQ